jgi:hypothetical protein
MKSAAEIINSNSRLKRLSSCTRGNIAIVINEARREAIELCAERAKSEWVRWGEHMGHQVEKQSILSLINELK